MVVASGKCALASMCLGNSIAVGDDCDNAFKQLSETTNHIPVDAF